MAAADGALGARLAGSRTPSSLGSSRSYIRLVQACQRQIRLGSYLSARDCLLSVACARARGLAGSKPLQIWERKVQNGHIKRITDNDIQSSVLEIMSTNISTTFVSCPADAGKTLGIKLPFLVMIIKNLKKYFTFEVQVLDDKNVRRRFRASNYQSTTRVKPFICTMPMRLDEGWNQIQFNLSDFTRRAYGTNYIETLRVQIHANCRIRRIYFSDRLYSEEELPPEFKLFLPIQKQAAGAAAQ
jgi:hypothetical protein